jgi:hypothetical protein
MIFFLLNFMRNILKFGLHVAVSPCMRNPVVEYLKEGRELCQRKALGLYKALCCCSCSFAHGSTPITHRGAFLHKRNTVTVRTPIKCSLSASFCSPCSNFCSEVFIFSTTRKVCFLLSSQAEVTKG